MPYSIDKDAVERALAADPLQILRRYAPEYAARFSTVRGRGPCPVHQAKGNDPNFRLSPRGWKCFSHCERGGDLLDLCVRLSGRSFHDVLTEWGDARWRVALPPVSTRRLPPPAPTDPLAILRADGLVPEDASAVRRTVHEALALGPQGRAYLASRCLNPDFAAARGFRSIESPTEWAAVEAALAASYLPGVRAAAHLAAPLPRYCPALVVPHLGPDGVHLAELRFRLLEATTKGDRMRSLKGQGNTLANAHYLHAGGEVHICEGELDALTLEQLGLRAVGLPGATTWPLLLDAKEQLRAVSLLVLWFDVDETGEEQDLRFRERLAAEFGRSWVRERVWSAVPDEDGCKDVNEVHCRGTLAELVGGAPWRS